MSYLVDTNVLLRRFQPQHPMCSLAKSAVSALMDRSEVLLVTPQNLIEFWCVATRPESVNGLGLTPADADSMVSELEEIFRLIPETPEIYPLWRKLVVQHQVSGVRVHDLRLVAAMRVHGISHLLTFDDGDFKRFADITVVHPRDVSAQ